MPFCFYRFLIFVQEICQRASQNLDNISFTSNYIKYLEFTTAVSTVLIIVLKMENLKKKKNKQNPEVTLIGICSVFLFGSFKKKITHTTQPKHLFQIQHFPSTCKWCLSN